jgi:hypothetical protein
MTNTTDASNSTQDSQSTPIAVPYWPTLKLAVGSVNAALVVTYLEMRHPSPAPEPGRRYGLPVTVDFARMADELAVDRRTLGLAFMCISTWYGSEVQRIGAVRAGREFLNLKHSRFPRHKLYSIVAAREWKSLRALTLRRNWPLLTKTLEDAGITSICAVPGPSPLPRALPCQDLEKYSAPPSTLSTLPEILLHGVELAGDRRRTRYSRLRKAVKDGLVAPDALKVRRHKTEAVDPELSDELVARLSRRPR